MHLDPARARRVAGRVVLFALPLAIVQFFGAATGGGGPAKARASLIANVGAQTPAERALMRMMEDDLARYRRSEAELAAMERIERLRHEPFGPTPMMHGSGTRPQTPQAPAPTNNLRELPSFHLQAVMSGTRSTAPHALINGRPYSIGQTVRDTDWIVAEIDAETRSVALSQPATKRTITLTLRTPR